MADITMPQLGETVTEGTITRWAKQVGDKVDLDEVLFEVSTDKVDTEVPSAAAGYLTEILVPEGETVDVGTRLAVIADAPAGSGGGARPSGDEAAAPAVAPPAAVPPAAPLLPRRLLPPRPLRPLLPRRLSPPPAAARRAGADDGGRLFGRRSRSRRPARTGGGGRSPAGGTAALARTDHRSSRTACGREGWPDPDRGTSWSVIGHRGGARQRRRPPALARRPASHRRAQPRSGDDHRHGRRRTDHPRRRARADRRQGRGANATPPAAAAGPAAAAAGTAAPPAAPGAVAAGPAASPAAPAAPAAAGPIPPAGPATAAPPGAASGADAEREQIIPFSKIRRITAEHMVRSKATSAHTLVAVEVDYEGVDKVRRALRESFKAAEGHSLTYLPFISRAVVDAIAEFPHVNASVGDDQLIVHRYLNLGIAVDLNFEGLLVPVIHDADSKRLRALAREINDLATRARTKRLNADDIAGGTFTITNAGPFGTLLTAAVINQPQVAILSTDGVKKKPVAIELPDGTDAIVVHPVGILALSFDHRAFDGAYAAAFVSRVRDILETRDWSQEL